MTTAAEREEILKGILEVLEVEGTVYQALVGESYTTPRKIYRAKVNDLTSALADQGVVEADINEITAFRDWMHLFTEDGTKLPSTAEEWKLFD